MKVNCNNLVKFFNKAYEDYKNKNINKTSCLKKVHFYETKQLEIKIPDEPIITININEDNEIYKPLGFILSNLDNKKFLKKKENEEAFEVLELLLNIINFNELEEKKKDKKLLGNINVSKDIVKIMKFGDYIFTKIQDTS